MQRVNYTAIMQQKHYFMYKKWARTPIRKLCNTSHMVSISVSFCKKKKKTIDLKNNVGCLFCEVYRA